MRKGTIKHKIMSSLAITFIPLIACVFISVIFTVVIINSLFRTEEITFDRAVSSFEREIQAVASRAQMLAFREPYPTLASLDKMENAEDEDLRSFYDSLANIKEGISYIDQVAFVFDGGFAITNAGAMETDYFLGDLYYSTGINIDTIYALFSEEHILDVFFYEDNGYTLFISDVGNNKYPIAKIMWLVNNKKLNYDFQEMIDYENYSLLLKGENGSITLGNKANSGNHVKAGAFTQINYEFDVPINNYRNIVYPLIILSIISIIMTLSLAATFTVLSIKRDYKRVSAIKEKMEAAGFEQSDYGDLEFIGKSADALIESRNDLERESVRNREIFINNILLRSLRNLPLPDKQSAMFEEYNLIPQEEYSVVVVAVSSSELMNQISNMDVENAIFNQQEISKIRRQLAELYFKPYFLATYVVDGEESSYLVLFNKKNYSIEEVVAKIKECAREYQSAVIKQYNIFVSFAIGGIVDSISKLNQSYRGAEEVKSFTLLLGSENEIVDYGQIRIHEKTLAIDLSEYKKLRDSIQQKDFRSALELFDGIIKQEFTNLTSKELTCKLWALIDRLNTELVNATINFHKDFLQKTDITGTLLSSGSVKSLRKNAGKIFTELAQYVETNVSANADWIAKAKEYIEEHCTENTFGVSLCAERFNFSLSYFSRVFKKETGEGVFEYIQRQRILRAKKMLNDGKAIGDIALAVGFLDSSSFIKAFKKCENCTPSQYKRK